MQIAMIARGRTPEIFGRPHDEGGRRGDGPRRRATALRSHFFRLGVLALGVLAVAARLSPAAAFTAYVSNEKGNSISIIDTDKLEVTKTVKVGQRPRGIALSQDGGQLFICAGDDDAIQILDTKTLAIIGDLPSGPDPELLILSPDGKLLYTSNENDNLVTAIDVATRKVVAEIPVGVEPEGMALSPDGKVLVNTSETTNMAHLIDTQTRKIFANVLVDARPRSAQYTADGSELWVSAEVGGTVSVIDAASNKVKQKIAFEIPGLAREAVQPVGIQVLSGWQEGVCGAWPRQPRRGDRRRDKADREISSRRTARLAIGLYAGRKISLYDQWRVE